jgi:hypothetical protein
MLFLVCSVTAKSRSLWRTQDGQAAALWWVKIATDKLFHGLDDGRSSRNSGFRAGLQL